MVDDANRTDFAAEKNVERPNFAEPDRADAATPDTDMKAPRPFDVNSYAEKIYRANLKLSAAAGQIEYKVTPELQNLLSQASAASTIRRRRNHRT